MGAKTNLKKALIMAVWGALALFELVAVGSPYASNPEPPGGCMIDAILVVLSWDPGDYAVSHDIYFSTNFDDVNNNDPAAFRKNTPSTSELLLGLVRGQTYYWRINEVNDAHLDSPWYGDVWSFKVRGYKAFDPNPPDGAGYVSLDPLLEWNPGSGAVIHYVYFGTDFDDVSTADTSSPEFRAYVWPPDSNWAPVADGGLTLQPHSYYYWRIDESPDGFMMYKGDVWSFRTSSSFSGYLFVDIGATGAGNGSSWADAFIHLQDALASAGAGDEIRVAKGMYKPDANTANPGGSGSRTATFQLINGVSIKGGYAGVGAGEPNERDIGAYETILNGDLNGDDVGFTNNGENSYHVVIGSGTGSTAILDGFTITAGNANASGNYHGGGMNNASSSPTITNCTFSGNSASIGGGMINDNSSTPVVTNCTFSGNSVDYHGGGMFNNYNSSPVVTNCTFSGNSASWGGGMYNQSESSPTITNCTFSGNSATEGGGMYNNSSSPTITNCILWDNTAPTGPQIYNYGTSSATVSYSDVQGGWAGTGNINADPCFADPYNGDYHLKSQAGRWDPNTESWVRDANTSVAIDAGDPADPIGYEPFPNGGIINMGAYSGTEEASKSYCGDRYSNEAVAADINGDCKVDFFDFAVFAAHWLEYTGLE